MKHLKKIWHTNLTERKDPYMEMNKHLRVTRAKQSHREGTSADLLWQEVQDQTPRHEGGQATGRKDIKEVVEQDRRAKERQKHYKDLKFYVKDHNIKMLERKSKIHHSL